MKYICAASILCDYGVLGGGLFADADALFYRTGKLTIPNELRNLRMPFAEIRHAVISRRWLLMPVLRVELGSGEQYRFLVFSRRNAERILAQAGVNLS